MLPPFMIDGRNTAEVFLSNMDYAQVGAAVVVQEIIDGNQNDYLAIVQNKYPDRFFCMGMLTDNNTREDLAQQVNALSKTFRGIAIPGHRIKGSLVERMPLFKAMEEKKMTLSMCLADDEKQIAEMAEVIKECPWASTGKPKNRERVVITSLELKPEAMEARNLALQEKYRKIQETEVRYEQQQMDDADYAIVAFGSAARLSEKAIEVAREEGLKVGLFRPITLWPFPTKEIAELAKTKKGILVVEINAGQMVQDVRLAVNGQVPVEQFGRLGGIVPEPEEIVNALKNKLM